MSSGMPSMTALLGMLALAGYQNRDKISEILRGGTPASSPQPGAGTQPAPLGGLLGNLSGMSGGAVGSLLSGGLGELIEKFKQNGQGDIAQSWVSNAPNKEISPPELKQAIGPDVLATLEQQTGLSQQNYSQGFHENCQVRLISTHLMANCPFIICKKELTHGHPMDHYHRLHCWSHSEVHYAG
jgi:uncharacterized protein YidB (DUF937 family)